MVCYVGLVYPRPRFGLLSRGEAVRGEPAQYISMRAPETTVVIPNGSHYRDSQQEPITIINLEHCLVLNETSIKRPPPSFSPNYDAKRGGGV